MHVFFPKEINIQRCFSITFASGKHPREGVSQSGCEKLKLTGRFTTEGWIWLYETDEKWGESLLLDESTEGDINMHSSKGFIIILVSEESHPVTAARCGLHLYSVRLNPGKCKLNSYFPACEAQHVVVGVGQKNWVEKASLIQTTIATRTSR